MGELARKWPALAIIWKMYANILFVVVLANVTIKKARNYSKTYFSEFTMKVVSKFFRYRGKKGGMHVEPFQLKFL